MIGALVLWIEAGFGSAQTNLAVVDFVNVAAALGAAAACWSRRRREGGRQRKGWTAIALACLAWGLGVSYVAYVDLVAQQGVPFAQRTLPFPSIADVGFLAFIPLAFAGVLVLPKSLHSTIRNGIDASLVGVALLLIAWVVLLRDLGLQDHGTPLETALLLAYPYGDVLLAAAAICAWEFVPAQERSNLLLVVVGLGFLAMADFGFYALVAKDEVGISAINALWPAGFATLALAALQPTPLPEAVPERKPTRALVPLSAAGAFLAASFTVLENEADATLAMLSVLLLGGIAARWLHWSGQQRRLQQGQRTA